MIFEFSNFIDDPIEVFHKKQPVYIKKPSCPDGFIWRNQFFQIEELLSSWVDFGRQGRMQNNIQPEHASRARIKGSWGVGRFYFQVKTQDIRFFKLYYNRAPHDVGDRMGHWILYAEIFPKTNSA
jgi:hypothetical protein